MKVSEFEAEKPLVILVHEQSFLRLWMETSLSRSFRLHVFSGAEEALAFTRSTTNFDVLVSELDLGGSAVGGCNIAREVRRRFPESVIFIFSNGRTGDHRLWILQEMEQVRFLSKPLDAFFINRLVKLALNERPNKREDQ